MEIQPLPYSVLLGWKCRYPFTFCVCFSSELCQGHNPGWIELSKWIVFCPGKVVCIRDHLLRNLAGSVKEWSPTGTCSTNTNIPWWVLAPQELHPVWIITPQVPIRWRYFIYTREQQNSKLVSKEVPLQSSPIHFLSFIGKKNTLHTLEVTAPVQFTLTT